MRDCRCETCRISKSLDTIAAKCTPDERAAIELLWNRMEDAEAELGMMKAKQDRP